MLFDLGFKDNSNELTIFSKSVTQTLSDIKNFSFNELWNGASRGELIPSIDAEEATRQLNEFAAQAKSAGMTSDEYLGTLGTKVPTYFRSFISSTTEAERTTQNYLQHIEKCREAQIKNGEVIEKVGLKTKLASAGMNALSMAGNMLVGMAISAGIQLIVTGLDNIINRTEKLIEAGNKAKQTISDIGDSYNTKQDTVSTNKDKYIELSQGVDNSTNQNLSLTTDQYSEFLNISNQLAQTFPSLVTGYDAQGNALLSLSGNADETTDTLERLLEQERQLADFKISQNLQTAFDGTIAQIGVLQKEIDGLNTSIETYNNLGNAMSNIVNGTSLSDLGFTTNEDTAFLNQFVEYGDTSGQEVANAMQEAFTKAAKDANLEENLNFSSFITQDMFKDDKVGYEWSAQLWGLTQEQLEAFKTAYMAYASEMGIDISEFTTEALMLKQQDTQEIQANWNSMVQSLITAMSVYDGYNQLGDNIKQAINTGIGNIDPVKEWMDENGNISAPDNIRAYLRQQFLDPITNVLNDESLSAKSKQTFSDAINAVFSLDGTTLNAQEYQDQLNAYLDVIKGFFDNEADFNDFTIRLGLKVQTEDGQIIDSRDSLINSISDRLKKENDTSTDLTSLDTLTYQQLVNVETKYTDTTNGQTLAEIVKEETAKAKEIVTSIEPITLSSLLSPDAEGNQSALSKTVDEFQSNMSTIQESLDSLRNGEDIDLTDLVQAFPELADGTDDLNKSLSKLKTDTLVDFTKQWKKSVSTLTDPKEINNANKFFKNLMQSMDMTEDEIADFRTEFSKIAYAGVTGSDSIRQADFIMSQFDALFNVSTAFDEFKTKAMDVINSIQSVNAALSNSVSGSGLSVEIDDTTGKIVGDITDIQNAYKDLEGYDAEVLFEKTANGIHINREALKALQSQQEALTKQNFLKEQADLQKQLTAAIKEQQNYAQGTDGYTNVQANIDSLREQIQTVQALSSAYDGATSKFQKFLNAGSTNNERDSFESIAKSYSSMQELLNEGWVTDDSLTAYLDLMLSASQRTGDAITDFEKLGQTIEGTSHSLKDYFTFDDNGDITSEGLWNFADDVNAKLGEEYAKIDAETGQYSFDFTGEKLQEVADAFNTTPEAIELFAKAMSDANMVVRFGGDELDGYSSKMEELQKSASDAQEKLKEMQSQGEFSADIDLNFNTAEMSVDDIKSKIEELKTERIEIEASGNTEGLQAIDNEISALESQQIVMSIQAEVSEGTTVDELLSMTDEQLATTLEVDTSQVDEARSALQSLQNETMETSVTVKIDETQFSQMVTSPETSTITVDANNQPAKDNIDKAVKYGESQKIEIPVTTEPIDTSGISNGASEENGDGINVKVHVDSSEVDNYVPTDKEAEVVYKKDSSEPDNYHPANKSAIAKYNVNAKSVYDWTPPTKRGEVIYTVKVNGNVPHDGIEGEFASGTMLSPAHASGTAYNVLNMQSIGAYAGGNVALPKDQKALVNEEQINGHSESIVRDGKWFLIPGGAHVENLKKGDLIFSAKQTDDLLKSGRTAGHARAYAEGTIPYTHFLSNSYAGGLTASGYNPWNRLNGVSSTSTSTSQTQSTKSYQQNTQSVNQNTTAVNENTDATDHSTSVFDWVATRLEVFANKVQSIADTITDFVSSTFKKSRLKMQISAIDNQIAANQRAAATYMQVADELAAHYEYYDENGNKQSLTIPEEYKQKVQQGDWLVEEMDTSTDFNKNLAEAIQKYQEYYDKATDCSMAVQTLKNDQMDLFNDLINIPIEEAEKKIDRLQNKLDVFNAAYSSVEGASGINRYAYQIKADAGMNQIEKQLNTAKKQTKSSIESLKKVAKDSGDKKTANYINSQIKNAKYIDTKGLSGDTLKYAEQYNTNLKNQRNIQQKYNDKKSTLSETQKIILDNQNKPTYLVQSAILGKQLDNKRQESEAYEDARRQTAQNRATTQKDLEAAKKDVSKFAKDMLSNPAVTKYLSKAQISAIKSGNRVDRTGITDPTILKTLENYNVLVDEKRTAEEKDTIALNAMEEAAKNAAVSQAEYAQMALETEQQRFDNIKAYYDSEIEYRKGLQDSISKSMDLKKAQGKDVLASDYKKELAEIEEQKKLYEAEKQRLKKQRDDSVKKGVITEGSKEWIEMTFQIMETGDAIKQCEIDALSLQDTMREETMYRGVTKALEELDKVQNRLESIRGLIDDEMMFDENGKLTEFGITAMAMDIKDYESNLDELNRLKLKRDQIIKNYNNGDNDTGFNEKEFKEQMDQIEQEMLSTLSNANSIRKSIINTITSQAKAEMDAIYKVIDAREELLKKQKEYYDYDKTLKSKTKDIQLLQQQLAALNGVAGMEAKAKRAELQAQLKEAQDDLDETIYEHTYDLQINGLDELKTELQNNYDAYVKDLNTNLESITGAVDNATNNINNCLGTVNDTIQKLLNTFSNSNYGKTNLTGETLGVPHYARGTRNAKGGWAVTQEKGGEIVLNDGSVLVPVDPGAGVIPSDLTDNLLRMAHTFDYNSMVKNITPEIKFPDIQVSSAGNGDINVHYDSLIRVDGNVDKNCVGDIKDIANQLLKNRDFMYKTYYNTQKEMAKDLRKAGW